MKWIIYQADILSSDEHNICVWITYIVVCVCISVTKRERSRGLLQTKHLEALDSPHQHPWQWWWRLPSVPHPDWPEELVAASVLHWAIHMRKVKGTCNTKLAGFVHEVGGCTLRGSLSNCCCCFFIAKLKCEIMTRCFHQVPSVFVCVCVELQLHNLKIDKTKYPTHI